MTTLVMTAILFFGISAYFKLPVSAMPDISYPTLLVSASYPGANAEKMADLIAGPLERQFMSNVTDVNIMASSSYFQNTQIIIQFDLNKDIAIAMAEVQQGINEAQNQLPPDLPSLPTYNNVNPAQTPIMYLVLSSPTVSIDKLYEWAYIFLGQRISLLDGVAQVTTYGYPHAVRLFLDPQALAAKGIGFNEVDQFINQMNPDLTVGNFYGKNVAYSISSDAQMFNAEQYGELIVTYQNGEPVRFRDLGYADNSVDNNKQYFKIVTSKDINPCCVLAIQRQQNANTIATSNRVLQLVNGFKDQIPGDMQITVPYNQSAFIIESVDDVEMTLLIALVLVVTIIYLYLGRLRNTIIPSITLPLTVIGTWAVMYLLGFSLDILSLLALTLSIGFLIDDAIIVLENIVRHVQEGAPPFQGALKGSKQISFTVISTSLSLCAVFIPMLFMSGVIGKLFHEFAAVIIVAIVLSAFISLSLTPMMCSRFLSSYEETGESSFMEKKSDQMNQFLVRKYMKYLTFAVKHKLAVIFVAGGFVALNIFLYSILPKTFLPTDDIGVVQVFLQSTESTSPYAMKKYQKILDDYFQRCPEAESTISINGNPTANQGMMFVNLKPIKERPPIQALVSKYMTELNRIPGISSFPKIYPLMNLQIGTSQSGKGQYQYVLQSYEIKELYAAADRLYGEMQKNPFFSQVTTDLQLHQPQIKVEILKEQARSYQVTSEEIQKALSLAYGETYITRLNAPQNQYYVVMQVKDDFYTNPTDFSLLYVKSAATGEMVPIESVINTKNITGPINVNHVNGIPSVTLSFNLPEGVPLGTSLQTLHSLVDPLLTKDITGQVAGSADVFKQSFASLKFLFVIAIVVIYLILGILYENFIHPLTVLSTLPPAVLGGFLSAHVTGNCLKKRYHDDRLRK